LASAQFEHLIPLTYAMLYGKPICGFQVVNLTTLLMLFGSGV